MDAIIAIVFVVIYPLIGAGVALYAATQLRKPVFRAYCAGTFWPFLFLLCVGIRIAKFMSEEIANV